MRLLHFAAKILTYNISAKTGVPVSSSRSSLSHFKSPDTSTYIAWSSLQHFWRVLSTLFILSASLSQASEVDDIAKLAGSDKPAALLKLDQLLTKNPKNFEGRLLRGIILGQQGKTEEAITLFTQLSKENPKSPIPLNNLAVIYAGQKDYAKALSTLEAVKALDGNYPIVHLNIGDIYVEMAADAYNQLLQIKPDFKPAQAKLGMVNKIIRNDLEMPPNMPNQANAQPTSLAKSTDAPEAAKSVANGSEKKTPPSQTLPISKKAATNFVSPEKALQDTVAAWATAWSKQQVSDYLAFYADTFKTPHGESLADWQKMRHSRMTKPAYIRVMPIDLAYSIQGDNAVVTFKQIYEADGKEIIDSKKLAFTRQGEAWKIVQEEVVKP